MANAPIPSSIAAPIATNSPDDIQRQVQQMADRPIYRYTVPERLAKKTGIKKIGIVEITAREHEMAIKRVASTDSAAAVATMASYQLALQCLVEVNDKRVSVADGSADAVWGACNQAVRDLVAMAYNDVNGTEGDENADFLKSRTVSV